LEYYPIVPSNVQRMMVISTTTQARISELVQLITRINELVQLITRISEFG